MIQLRPFVDHVPLVARTYRGQLLERERRRRLSLGHRDVAEILLEPWLVGGAMATT
jgi:hypothetical protein